MKRIILYLLFLSPFLSYSQTEGPALKNFGKHVKFITNTLKWDDHVSIVEINNDNEFFDLVAVDENMNELWRTNVKGYALGLVKFKGKVLAIAATDYTDTKANNNTYNGFLVDAANGKIALQKTIYDAQQDHITMPTFVTDKDGSVFKLFTRQTKLTRKFHLDLPRPLSIITLNSLNEDLMATTDLTITEFDSALNPLSSVKPLIQPGVLTNTAINFAGDIAFAWCSKGTVKMVRYANGSTQSDEITKEIKMKDQFRDQGLAYDINIVPSKKNKNVYYFSLMIKNLDGEQALSTSIYDYRDKTMTIVNTEITKQDIKDMESSYKPINQMTNTPDIGSPSGLEVRKLEEVNDRLIVIASVRSFNQIGTVYSGISMTLNEKSLLITGYDLGLNLKYQQQLPSAYKDSFFYLKAGYTADDNLYRIAGYRHSSSVIYATLNVTTGAWVDMQEIPRENVTANFPDASHTLWFPKTFIVPYIRFSGVGLTANQDLTLQLNKK